MSHYPLLLLLLFAFAVFGQQDETEPTPGETPPEAPETNPGPGSVEPLEYMTVDRLDVLLRRVDPELQRQENSWQLQLRGRPIIAVADPKADRMRMMSPIVSAAELEDELLYRLLQANFDSALDARYAVANNVLWSVFIHPLSPLSEQQLSSALFQTYTAAATFGTLFTSGMFIFGGGDSNEELEKLREEIDKLLHPAI